MTDEAQSLIAAKEAEAHKSFSKEALLALKEASTPPKTMSSAGAPFRYVYWWETLSGEMAHVTMRPEVIKTNASMPDFAALQAVKVRLGRVLVVDDGKNQFRWKIIAEYRAERIDAPGEGAGQEGGS